MNSMLYLLDKLLRGKPLKLCERCGLKFAESNNKCPHCSHISDRELSKLLAHRAGFRLGLGKVMWLGAVLLFVVMILVNI